MIIRHARSVDSFLKVRWGAFGASLLAIIAAGTTRAQTLPPEPKRIVRADIVALDQLLVYNRFGSFNPFGMIFALGRDVESRSTPVQAFTAPDCAKQLGTEGRSWDFNAGASGANAIGSIAGNARLRDCKRPRPLVLRANVGDVLEVRLANLLLSHDSHGPYGHDASIGKPAVAKEREKPGFSDTFCETRKEDLAKEQTAARYGADLEGQNDEDAVRNAADANCRLAERKDWIEKNPAAWNDPPSRKPGKPHLARKAEEADWPSTRHVSLVINGLTSRPDAQGKVDSACRGLGAVVPGKVVTCRWELDRDGTHFIASQAAVAGGEGDGGSLTHGLFGALIVEPEGSKAYRSQITSAALDEVWPRAALKGQHARMSAEIKDYEKADSRPGSSKDRPILNLHRKISDASNKMPPVHEIVHADLNAVISEPKLDAHGKPEMDSAGRPIYQSFREFTAILHDELKTFYPDRYLELAMFGGGQLAGARDGFAINYGASGMGTMLIANRKRIGPAADCVDCLYEESFLQSWVNGDPALLEHYPDDPSNVHHSYLNDRVVFRNFHAGPKETHIFHLHAHQWFAGNDRNRGSYLDSQTVGPQQGFSYRIYGGGLDRYGLPETVEGLKAGLGAGNANRTVGDSIFHCHLYPHFAQGMWALWRNHDVLEDGTRLLPDGQDKPGLSTEVRPAGVPGIGNGRLPSRGGTFLKSGKNILGKEEMPQPSDFLAESSLREGILGGGTPIPAIVPMPGLPAPVLPTYGEDGMPGYPFYIPGQAGRRAPQAPMDIARKLENSQSPTPVLKAEVMDGGLPRHILEYGTRAFDAAEHHAVEDKFQPVATMAQSATATLARSLALANFGAHIKTARLSLLPYDGTALERRAMAFHFNGSALSAGETAPKVKSADGSDAAYSPAYSAYAGFAVNGGKPRPGAPFADPCALPLGKHNLIATRLPSGRYVHRRTISPVVDVLAGAAGTADLMPDPGLIGFRRYEVSAIQLRLVVNRAGWHDPQSRINMLSSESDDYKETTRGDVEPFFFRAHSGECIEFRHTNELPKDLARDDFQVKTPTDTIGQHIHLVKFDVMAADGSANGWNYEDGTFAPDEVHHRVCAGLSHPDKVGNQNASLQLRALGRACSRTELTDEERQAHAAAGKGPGDIPDLHIYKKQRKAHPDWFQTTVQRWFADPLLSPTGRDQPGTSNAEMRDRTLRTVFTHDHFGPSSIQQHGFYSALVIEPQQTLICDPTADAALNVLPTSPMERFRDKAARGVAQQCAAGPAAYVWSTESRSPSLQAPYYIVGGKRHVGARKLVLADAAKALEIESDYIKAGATPEQAKTYTADALRNLNLREYALAVADFAVLYDAYGKRPADTFYETAGSMVTGDGRETAKGLDCLIIEARLKAAASPPAAFSKGCDPRVKTGLKAQIEAGNVPPAFLAPLDQADAETLAGKTHAEIRKVFGYPVSPPQRPEAISVDHHDPYVVNYRNEPIPLRVGESSSASTNYPRRPCRAISDQPELVSPKPGSFTAHVDRQKTGEPGDMANVFRSTHDPSLIGDIEVLHADPCTPVIEAYEGERVQVRLIQGAQEVQHAFTLEGYTFPRNIDQRLPSDQILVPHRSAWLNARPTRQHECFEQSKRLPLPKHLDQAIHQEIPALDLLRSRCDNIDGRIAAQEIGISEHFEFTGRFGADGTTASPVEGRAKRVAFDRLADRKAHAETDVKALTAEDTRRLSFASIGGDNLYHFGTQDALWNGAWGLVRVARSSGFSGLLPDYIDHTACLSASAPGMSGPYLCRNSLELRLPMLESVVRQREDLKVGILENSPRGLEAVPPARTPVPAADVSVNCPVLDEKTAKEVEPEVVAIAAIRQGKMPYSALLSDNDALRLVPDDGTSTAEQLARKSNGPLVIRVNAGRCLQLKVRNLLPAALDRHRGDARMPGIASLNVDYGDWDEKTGVYRPVPGKDALKLRHSSRLALSIPLTSTQSRSGYAAPFGTNFTGAARPDAELPDPATGEQKLFKGQTLTYYAGTLDASWLRFEAAIAKSTLPAACTGYVFTNVHSGFAAYNETSMDVLGKRYAAVVTGPVPRSAKAFTEGLRTCLTALVVEHKTPRPYAFGPVPIKSFGDVIGHTSHGMIGTVIVEPEGASVALASNTALEASACPAATSAAATTGTTARLCLSETANVSAAPHIKLTAGVVSEHVLFWQDGLNLKTGTKPVADCHVCDDSYDFGKRGVSYKAAHLVERIGAAAPSPMNGGFDLNRVSIPKDIYTRPALPLPPLFSRADDEVTFRLIHSGGRARQRAFVMTGAGYEDLFPGFGFPSSALLAPGKAVSATLLRHARARECNFWRDGPAYMVGQGAWGLHAVGEAVQKGEDICTEAAK